MCISDTLAFFVIIFFAMKAKEQGLKLPVVSRIIAEGAIWYFLIIFTSHFVFEMTLTLGRVSTTTDPHRTAPNIISCVFFQDTIRLLPGP